ncbi:MAG TPA: YceI family protein [Verrucomicrobiae bacterium]|nr:YceI family protein [Verrucomicrobiae bacterium]
MAPSPDSSKGLLTSYIVDASRSRFVVRVTATGLLSAFGHNPTVAIRGFRGEASFDEDAPAESSLRLAIDATSLSITGDVNEKDRAEMEAAMKNDVLEAARYPEIGFDGKAGEASKIADGMYRIKLAGRLNLHGVTGNLEIPCNLTVGGGRLRAGGEFTIRQTDYQIRPVSAAGGALKVKDELRFSFDIAADRKKEVE